jgi:hypothetical protein
MTGQPFLGRLVKRHCGVLFLAAEGQHEMRIRLAALVQEKCGGMSRAPFRWFEDVPVLLQPDGLALLVAMGKQAATSLQQEFGLPLGLIIIDTVAASAGYNGIGAENDNAVNQRPMQLNCFVLGVDHFGKDANSGTRGGSSKESSGELVLACLGQRELSGRVVNTRLAVRGRPTSASAVSGDNSVTLAGGQFNETGIDAQTIAALTEASRHSFFMVFSQAGQSDPRQGNRQQSRRTVRGHQKSRAWVSRSRTAPRQKAAS